MRYSHLFFMMLFFACLGVTCEIVFTAIVAFFNHSPLCDSAPYALAGKSYVWMMFIYAVIPVLGVYFHHRINHWNIFFRLMLYVIIIYLVEFISGYLLQLLTGSCPWKYTTGHNILGLIQLDYFPAWLVFAWLIEKLFLFVNARVIK